jgi:hypothetical protein
VLDPGDRDRLDEQARTGGYAYVRNLVAAEAAVLHGQFNVAKILRALAHTQWVRAMEAARLLAADSDPTHLFQQILHELPGDNIGGGSPSLAALDARDAAVKVGVTNLVVRAVTSLAAHSDVQESDVDQFVWACFGCGNLTEGEAPDGCSVCGAQASEFRRFEPFYSVTPEHLGRQSPAEIVTVLASIPDMLAATVAGVADSVLGRKPSPGEWGIKEIMAHMLETDLLFARRAHTILAQEPGRVPGIESPIPPWLLHEGKRYEELTAQGILARLRQVRADSLTLLGGLASAQWGWYGTNGGTQTTLLDLGTWLANHDQGHLVQIRRLTSQ